MCIRGKLLRFSKRVFGFFFFAFYWLTKHNTFNNPYLISGYDKKLHSAQEHCYRLSDHISHSSKVCKIPTMHRHSQKKGSTFLFVVISQSKYKFCRIINSAFVFVSVRWSSLEYHNRKDHNQHWIELNVLRCFVITNVIWNLMFTKKKLFFLWLYPTASLKWLISLTNIAPVLNSSPSINWCIHLFKGFHCSNNISGAVRNFYDKCMLIRLKTCLQHYRLGVTNCNATLLYNNTKLNELVSTLPSTTPLIFGIVLYTPFS